MKEKIITIKPKGISQKQWASFLLELNLMKKAWKSYGVDVEIKAPGLKNIIKWGTTINNDTKRNRRTSNKVEQDERPEV
jgi:hypothetical protein